MYKSHLDLFFCEFWKEFFFKDFINLRERESEHKQGKRQTEEDADSPLSKEPDVGFDSRTLGS